MSAESGGGGGGGGGGGTKQSEAALEGNSEIRFILVMIL